MPKHMKNPLRDMFWIGMDIDIHRSLKPCLRFLAGSISCRSMHMVAPSCVTSLHKDLTPNRGFIVDTLYVHKHISIELLNI
jgi:hypothetical protein